MVAVRAGSEHGCKRNQRPISIEYNFKLKLTSYTIDTGAGEFANVNH